MKDKVERTMIALRVGVDDFEKYWRQTRLIWAYYKKRWEVEIKKVLELKTEGQRKRDRPVKQWINVVE